MMRGDGGGCEGEYEGASVSVRMKAIPYVRSERLYSRFKIEDQKG